MKYLCSYHNCKEEAIDPTKALMKYYSTSHAMTRIVCDLKVCGQHLPKKEEVITPENLEGYIKIIENQTGVTVDRTNHPVVLVPFDAPDYATLLNDPSVGKYGA